MGRREVRELSAAAGRDPGAVTMSVRVEVELHGNPPRARAANRAWVPGDDPAAIIAAIEAYRSVGVEHIVLAPNSGAVPRITSVMETIARRVMPQFR